MKCPNCDHISRTAAFKCSACGETFDQEAVERLQHLEYLLAWLDDRIPLAGREAHLRLREQALVQRDALRETMGIAPAPPHEALEPDPGAPPRERRPREEVGRELADLEAALGLLRDRHGAPAIGRKAVAALHRHLRQQADALKAELGGARARFETPSRRQAVDYAIARLLAWGEALGIDPAEVASLVRYLRGGLRVPPQPRPEKPAAAEPSPSKAKVRMPTKREKPPFDWRTWWERTWRLVTSRAALQGLLYLGAFMIVVSTTILVVRFWEVFPEVVQLAFIASVPTAFYLAGWGVHSKLRLPQAGDVLTGIGALLVAVDFAAVYRFGGLAGQVDPTGYWMGASVVCTGIYALTAWRRPREPFGHVTLIGACSALLAGTRLLDLPLEWEIASLTAFSAALGAGAALLAQAPDRWRHLVVAARRFASVPLTLGVTLALFVPGDPSAGQLGTYLFAALGYATLAWRFPNGLLAHAAVWSSIGAITFALRAIALPVEWHGAILCALAPLYLASGRWLDRRLPEGFPHRRAYLVAANLAGWALVAIALLLGTRSLTTDLWAGVIALTLVSATLGWSAHFHRRPALVAPAAGLFIAPLSLASLRALSDLNAPQPVAGLMAVWAGLALSYLGLAARLRAAERYTAWLALGAQLLAPAAVCGLILDVALGPENRVAGPTLVALGLVIAAYAASAWLHDGGRHPALSNWVSWLPHPMRTTSFLWPIGVLLPAWLAAAWAGAGLEQAWLGAALTALALAYVGAGQWLRKRRAEYRFPAQVYAYALAVIGIAFAHGDRWALLTALYLAVGTLAALALAHRRAWEAGLAAAVFIWPFQLSLDLSPLTPHAHSLAYALLSAGGYLPLGVALDRAGRRYALPYYASAYALSAYALTASVAGRLGAYPRNVQWVGVAVPLIAAATQAFGVHHFRRSTFAWAAVLSLSIAFGQALPLLGIPPEFDAAAWVSLALGCLVAERSLAKGRARAWLQGFRWPLGLGSAAALALGLVLTADPAIRALTSGEGQRLFPVVLAQSMGVGLAVLAARLYRSRWPLALEPWLALPPVTLFFFGYGERLLGQALSPTQYGLVWLAFALIHLLAAWLLDRAVPGRTVGYAQGLYLAGYALVAFTALWTAPDRPAHLVTLGTGIALAVASQALVYSGRLPAFDQLQRALWLKPEAGIGQAARSAFLFAAAYAFPLWLAELLDHLGVPLSWIGLAFVLTAPGYLALGLTLRRSHTKATWPLYSAGYALTAVGAALALQDQRLAIYALALDAAVYAASAFVFRQPPWLYLSSTLLPVVALLTLRQNQLLTAQWVAWTSIGMAYLYVGVGSALDRRAAARRPGASPFALPFYALGYPLSAMALALATREKSLALEVFTAAVALYALSAWALRKPIFLYPAAWLATVPYAIGMTLTPLPPRWYGLGWLPLIAVCLALGRFASRRASPETTGRRDLAATLIHPATPFYLLAYTLSAVMMLSSLSDPWTRALSFTAAATIYLTSGAISRRPAWLYPGLLAAHLALGSAYALRPGGVPAHYLALLFLGMTWAMAAIGYGLDRRVSVTRRANAGALAPTRPGISPTGWPSLRALLTPSWSQPWFVFTAVDLLVWQLAALPHADTAIVVAVGNAALLGLLATLWHDEGLPYGSLALGLIAAAERLRWAAVPFAEALAWFGGIGFGLYLLGWATEEITGGRSAHPLAVWSRPLWNASVGLTALGAIGTLPAVGRYGTATTAALGFAGATYLAIAARGRHTRLGYLGMAMLELDWALVLIDRGITQPQWYAIPAGLYLAGVGHLERRQGRAVFGTLVESFGLAVLLVTSFIQSLVATQGFPYFALLLVEGLAVTWWGASQRRKAPFFLGIGASVLNVTSQVVLLIRVHEVNRWLIILGVGLLLVGAATFVERQRERIAARAQSWREVLEAWD